MDPDHLRGNLAAIEYLLGQLFVYTIEADPNSQAWLRKNLADISSKLDRQETFTDGERAAARETIFRVMQTASRSLETAGRGPSIG